MKLTDLALLSLQTAYMQKDLTTQGFCKGVQSEMRDMAASTYNILMYQTLNTLEDTEFGNALVDELAWQLHVDYYNPEADFDIKRNLVKKSIQIHRKKGTPQAVIDLIDTAFPSNTTTVLSEWWEYGGEPYHFKITTSSLRDVDINTFYKALNSVKNARSHIEDIYLFKEILVSAISRIKVNRTIEYKVDVGDFVDYGFQGGKVLSFSRGGSLKKYSFLGGANQKIEGSLVAPTISCDGDILTITNTDSNTETFVIFVDGAVTVILEAMSGVTSMTFNLLEASPAKGTHEITVKAAANGYFDSDPSNAVLYVVQPQEGFVLLQKGNYKIRRDFNWRTLVDCGEVKLYFVSCDKAFTSLRGFEGIDGTISYALLFYYSSGNPTNAFYWRGVSNDIVDYNGASWSNEKYRTLVTESPQYVPLDFYLWLANNARRVDNSDSNVDIEEYWNELHDEIM